MKINRTENTKRNSFWGVIYRILVLLLPFATRTILLRLLGEKYLGLGSLFSSVIQVLNLADLGIGSAIIYSMYKPIAEDDNETICALLNLYRKLFYAIGTIVLVIGLSLIPFLDKLTNGDAPSDINIRLVYIIYLLNTVISYYMFAYKKSLLSAFQRNDIETKISMLVMIFQYALQIGLLFIIKNYYLYVLALPLTTLINNLISAIVIKKKFPMYKCKGTVSFEVKSNIKKQVSGVFIGKLCGTTRNSLDSVFISMFLGLTEVAIYGNYFYILNGVHSVLTILTTSMIGGVGNSAVCETKEKNYSDFKKFSFLYSWIGGWCTCCMFCLYQHFMNIWVGEALSFKFPIMLLFCLYFFSIVSTDIKNVYVTATGLWWENRLRSFLEFAVNLVLNYLLGKLYGVVGIILATLITMIAVNFIYGLWILYKHYFTSESYIQQVRRHLFYFLITVIAAAITYGICSLLPNKGLIYLIVKAIVCCIVPNVVFFVAYYNTEEFKKSKPLFRSVLLRFCNN